MNAAPADTASDEAACLGAALLDADAVMAVYSDMNLRPSDFAEPRHRALFSAMLQMRSADEVIDALTVQRKIGADMDLLNQMLDACPVSTQGQWFAEQVIEASRKRRLGDLAAVVTEQARNGRASAEIVAELKGRLDEFEAATGTLKGIDACAWLDTEPPELEQVLADAFDLGDKVSVIGSSKMRKSFFTLQLALSLAAGRDFLSWTVPKPRRVLLAQFEIKAEHFHRRVRNMARAMGISPADIGDCLLIYNCRGITGETAIERIGAEAKKHHAEVVIFDPLYKLATGDENAAKDMKPTLAAFDRLAESTGAAVVYVHHDAKGIAGARDVRDRGAGSNVGRRDDDFCITLTAHDAEETSVVIDCLWRNYKPRDPFTATWTERGCFELSPDMPAVKKTSRSRSVTTPARPELETYQDAALKLVARKPLSIALFRSKVLAMSGMTEARQRRLVDIMLANEQLTEHRQRERGCHAAWIGTPEQIAEMRQTKMKV